ncbi:MAG: histidinol-phosphatase [Treponema sp.]|nr:histidinol-phosphatase [Treponema sp.]
MNANYHTHTVRCHHAIGTERQYIEMAIQKGFTKLGFSDHTPQPYPSDFVSRIRMTMDQLDEYVQTIKTLAKEYASDITIYTGLEVEYLPTYFNTLIHEIQQRDIDYIIMGQHFIPDERDGFYSGDKTAEEDKLKQYVDLVIEGLQTGKFTYLAHPDLINFIGPDTIYLKHMERLCNCMLTQSIPLEVNMLGFDAKRNYPCNRFFKLASDMGCSFVIGCDAHTPNTIRHPEEVAGFTEFLQDNAIQYNQDIRLIKP